MPNYSGFKYWAGGAQGLPDPSANKSTLQTDYPVLDTSTSIYRNGRTKEPWTGKLPNGLNVNQGKVVADPTAINPNDPNQRYRPIDLPKDVQISTAADDLLKNFTKSANDGMSHFNDLLDQFKGATGAAFKNSQAAVAAAPGTAARLQAGQSRYENALNDASSQYAHLNASDAAAQHNIVDRANALLPQYDQAAQNIGDRQVQELQKMVSRYKLGTGTPTSLGSDESKILARGLQDVLLPIEQAKIGRRYDILSNLELPIQRDITGRETNRIGSFLPSVAGSAFSSGQATDQAVQGLRERVANMSLTDAVRFMQASGVPIQMMQQIIGSNIGHLGQLAQLKDSSRYRGLMDVLGMNLSQPQGAAFNGSVPNFAPGGGGRYSSPLLAPNAPTSVSGTAGASATNPLSIGGADYAGYQPQYVNGTLTGMIPRGGAPTRINMDPNAGMYGNDGTQTGSTYNPATGAYIDQRTGSPTGYAPWARDSRYNPLLRNNSDYTGDVNYNPALAGLA